MPDATQTYDLDARAAALDPETRARYERRPSSAKAGDEDLARHLHRRHLNRHQTAASETEKAIRAMSENRV